MLEHVGYEASDGVAVDAALRTEDVRFSPSGRRIATIATDEVVQLFDIDVFARPIRITNAFRLKAPNLRFPHGLDFIADDVIAVANRRAAMTFYRLPPEGAVGRFAAMEQLRRVDSDWFGADDETRKMEHRGVVCGPGSVRRFRDELFICCNNRNTVSAHQVHWDGHDVHISRETLFAQDGLEIPDGVAISDDGAFVAVSDHENRRVVLYDRERRERLSVLRDSRLRCPHGLHFDGEGERLFVADAGGRDIHIFLRDEDWRAGQGESACRIGAVSQQVFDRTLDESPDHARIREGGAKGLDVDPSGTVLAITCRNLPLRFFEVGDLDAGHAAQVKLREVAA